jgi:hypothetical protein
MTATTRTRCPSLGVELGSQVSRVFERRLRRRNPILGEASEGAAAPSDVNLASLRDLAGHLTLR